jgi:hypothetical protein
LYLFGYFNVLFGKTLLDNYNNEKNSSLRICYEKYDEKNFYLNESEIKSNLTIQELNDNYFKVMFEEFPLKIKQNPIPYNYNNSMIIIKSINKVSASILDFNLQIKKGDFNIINLLMILRTIVSNYTNPKTALEDNNETHNKVEKSLIFFNNLINYEGFYPLSRYLKCEHSTNFEIAFDKNDCKFPYSDDNKEIHDQNCYLIQNIDNKTMQIFLEKSLGNETCNCTYFINDTNFCEKFSKKKYKDYIILGFQKLKNFYSDFVKVVDLITYEMIIK